MGLRDDCGPAPDEAGEMKRTDPKWVAVGVRKNIKIQSVVSL